MTTNFDFLKRNDKDLYEVINDAENLYREEFFEQCMTQTRRFGEIVCKKVLGSRLTTEVSFDAMLATLKDCTIGSSEEAKEFVDDLYFLKRSGNNATHSIKVKQDGMEALECLKRAFEVAINYCVYSCNENRKVLKLQYDVELLITGKKRRRTLADKYNENITSTNKKGFSTLEKKSQPQFYCTKSKQTSSKSPIFWYIVGMFSIISLFLIIFLELL